MKKQRISPGILVGVLAMFVRTSDARAGDISGPAMAGLVLNNTIPDSDLYALSLFAGTSPDILKTKAEDTTTGFTESLSGTYAGQPLSVTYTGDSSAFPGGPITWTSTGTYGTGIGAQAWNGSGSALFTFPTANTVQIAYSSALTIGSNTELNNTTITGTDNGTWLQYTNTTGTVTVNGVPMPAPLSTQGVFLSPIVGDLGYDDYEVKGRVTITSIYEICEEETSGSPYYIPTQIKSAGTIQLVPEPSSLVLAGFGVLSLLIGYASRRAARTAVRGLNSAVLLSHNDHTVG